MTKSGAREALEMEVAKQTGQLADGRILKDGFVTFEWFVRNRYFPLRQGDWRPETAKEKTAQIESDLIGKFGELRESIDQFVLQTHVNHLAGTLLSGQGETGSLLPRVHLRRSHRAGVSGQRPYPKAEDSQESPAEGQADPDLGTNLAILAHAASRDRLFLMLDITDALRPSEFFVLRWQSFDDPNTLSLTETVYRRKLSPFGKTPKSLGKVHLPDGLAAELKLWKRESPILLPMRSSFPTRRRNDRHRQLPEPSSEASGRRAGDSEAELPGAPPHDGDTGTESGIGEGHPVSPPSLAKRTPQPTSTCRRCRRVYRGWSDRCT